MLTMEQQALHAPWRIDYIRSLSKPDDSTCFLCDAGLAADAQTRKDRLVLWQTPHSVVLMNRYPYTNGHLLVCPLAHKGELGELKLEELLDLQVQTVSAIALLKRAMSPQGFNIGINLGRCAGAGVPGHIHQHIVPRWAGDTSFMSVVGDVRIIPQATEQLYGELLRLLNESAPDK